MGLRRLRPIAVSFRTWFFNALLPDFWVKLSDMWERFFNWQSDMDWTWGPFVGLRPARTQAIQPWVWVRLFVGLTGIGTLLVMVLVGVCVSGPKIAARQHWRLPPGVTETRGTLAAMGHDPGLLGALIGLALCLPPLFFAFCLPFHLAWNKRATRLSAAGAAQEEVTADSWPPAPRRS